MSEIWYRYTDIRYAAPLDEYETPSGPGRLEVRLDTFAVIKTTAKGVWLAPVIGDFVCSDRRFVLREATKRYACPSVEEARVSFVARKTKQARIHEARAARAREAIKIVEKMG